MIRSMTGFGCAEKQCEEWTIRAEARSVNHRDLQVSFRLPDALHAKESELQKHVARLVQRGHVYVTLNWELRAGQGELLIDDECVRSYIRTLMRLAQREGVPPNIELGSLLRLPGAVRNVAGAEGLVASLWPQILAVVDETMAALMEMRLAEGAHLFDQLTGICVVMDGLIDGIEEAQGGFVEGYRSRLRQRINRLLEGSGVEVNEDALAREVALYADRSDVSEEIARLRSHLAQFRQALDGDADAPVGRKMEFLGQEMLREAGTIAAKVPAGQQVGHVLELKSQIDRVREQVRNVE